MADATAARLTAPVRRVAVPDAVVGFLDSEPGAPSRLQRRAKRRIAHALAADPRLLVCSGWARVLVPPGSAAWTLGRFVLLRCEHWSGADPATCRLVAHELVHVAQWRERGVVGFLRRYLADYARGRMRGLGHWDAYRGIRDEVEAFQIEALLGDT